MIDIKNGRKKTAPCCIADFPLKRGAADKVCGLLSGHAGKTPARPRRELKEVIFRIFFCHMLSF